MSELSAKLRHDLRGAAVNISGFHGEVAIAAGELRDELGPHLHLLPEEVRSNVERLIDDDLIACTGFLGTAIDQLDETISQASGERQATAPDDG